MAAEHHRGPIRPPRPAGVDVIVSYNSPLPMPIFLLTTRPWLPLDPRRARSLVLAHRHCGSAPQRRKKTRSRPKQPTKNSISRGAHTARCAHSQPAYRAFLGAGGCAAAGLSNDAGFVQITRSPSKQKPLRRAARAMSALAELDPDSGSRSISAGPCP